MSLLNACDILGVYSVLLVDSDYERVHLFMVQSTESNLLNFVQKKKKIAFDGGMTSLLHKSSINPDYSSNNSVHSYKRKDKSSMASLVYRESRNTTSEPFAPADYDITLFRNFMETLLTTEDVNKTKEK
jgi:hypothetical protein